MFYPSHDIALGNGVRYFNEPAAAKQLREDLSWISDIWNAGRSKPLPWGWDYNTREALHSNFHIPYTDLPTNEELETLRQLSHRKTSIKLLEGVGYKGIMPQLLEKMEDVIQFIETYDTAQKKFVLKTPWSSSGRGLMLSTTPRPTLLKRSEATLRKMGSIMGETWLDKIQDFAMLFYIAPDEVRFLGYSLFDNEASGTYRQGYLLANKKIEQRLASIAGQPIDFTLYQQRFILLLTQLFQPLMHKSWEVGYIGIDMMLTRQGLMPCVEMNARCTMGIVARLYFDQHLEEDQEGRFYISPLNPDGHFEAKFDILK